MSKSLQDQLLALGVANKKKAKQAKHKQRILRIHTHRKLSFFTLAWKLLRHNTRCLPEWKGCHLNECWFFPSFAGATRNALLPQGILIIFLF